MRPIHWHDFATLDESATSLVERKLREAGRERTVVGARGISHWHDYAKIGAPRGLARPMGGFAPMLLTGLGPRLYPHDPSVKAGGTLELHVASKAPYFRLFFYRITGAGFELAFSKFFTNLGAGTYDEQEAGKSDAATDWSWPSVTIDVDPSQKSGAYIVWLQEWQYVPPPKSKIQEPIFKSSAFAIVEPDLTMTPPAPPATLVIIRPASTASKTLCVIGVFTYHAYNPAGGASFYGSYAPFYFDNETTLTLHRRGGGIGGDALGTGSATYIYDPENPVSSGFMAFDYRVVTWLQNNGYDPDFATDFDLSVDPGTSAGYGLMVFPGHQEYWSDTQKAQVDSFIKNGGNVAFLGGNTCMWRITHDPDPQKRYSISCEKQAADLWFNQGSSFGTDSSTTGLRFQITDTDHQREPAGTPLAAYTVQHDDHWLYENTELTDGDRFGRYSAAIGHEADGTAVEKPVLGSPIVPDFNAGFQTPASLQILAYSFLPLHWHVSLAGTVQWGGEQYVLTCVSTCRENRETGGTVVNVATLDWARAVSKFPRVEVKAHFLDKSDQSKSSTGTWKDTDLILDRQPLYFEPQVEVITRQMLDRLATPGANGFACIGDPVAAVSSGEIFVFARGAMQNQLVVRRTIGGAWTQQQLWSGVPGGAIRGQPAVTVEGGTVNVIARSASPGQLFMTSGGVNGFVSLVSLSTPAPQGYPAGICGEPIVVSLAFGKGIAVFVLAKDGNVWMAFGSGSLGAWTQVSSHPFGEGFAGRPHAHVGTGGNLTVLARTRAGKLWMSNAAAPDASWSQWRWMGAPGGIDGFIGDPILVAADDQHHHVFARANDNTLWWATEILFGPHQKGPFPTGWLWHSLGGELECRPAVVVTTSKAIQVFARAWARTGKEKNIAASTLMTTFQDQNGVFGQWFEIAAPSIGSRPHAVLGPSAQQNRINLFTVDRATFNVQTSHQVLKFKGGYGSAPGFPGAIFTSWEPVGPGP